MAKKKFYAVKKGKITGIFNTWDECKASVDGYSGAEYKSFSAEKEAEEYLTGKKAELDTEMELSETNQLIAYVDGSYDHSLGKYAFGCIIITPNGEIIKESGNGDNPESVALRNVAGEMLGAMYAVQWCVKNGYESIDIRYDYTGIEMWATGSWKAKNSLTQKYADFMKNNAKNVQITFKKIEAHSGDKYNEEADQLAKIALVEGNGIPKVKRGDYWFTVEKIPESDLETILELVKEEIGIEKISVEEKDIAYGKAVTLKLDKKDKVVVHHYGKNNKLVIQGKPQKLFSAIITYVMELVDVEEIPEIFNNNYKINIDKDEVRTEFQYYMPNSYDKLPEKLSRTLHQAVYNLKLVGDMFDGTFLAQPVIRAIEAHLKIVLIEKEIISDSGYVKDNGFDMFEKNGAKYKLQSDRMGKATADEAKYIGGCYTFYHNNRHQLSHWDDPMAPLDTTKLLDVGAAHDLIKRTLSLIDEYYEVI